MSALAPEAVPARFRIAVPDAVLDDLQGRLARMRWPDDFANADWRYGTNRGWLEDLVDYWRHGYDWRAQEAAMNRFEHYRVVLDGVPVHYLHRRGVGPAPLPLVLTHGWPWTFWDFGEVIDALADPAAHGGDPADAFEVVVPSLPGYGFSVPLTRSGVTVRVTAALWVRLMHEVLGHDRFGAHGGDWGASVSAQLGHEFPQRLIGVHLSLPVLLKVSYYSGLSATDYGPGEEGWFEKMQRRMATAASHVAVHSQDPQTLAYALADSPVGLASWLLERRRLWSDHDGDVFDALSRDFLLTSVMLYWVTGSIGTSMRFYWENWQDPARLVHERTPSIPVPTGIAVFPNDLVFVPRRLAEEHTNLARWTEMPRGGHFAAAEEPDLLVKDLRAFFRPLRGH
jgi:pimeloyl-ACP methyl ester carboxylesterase